MNDYRQRFGLNQPFEPSTTSMGKFFANRLRDSLHLTSTLTTNERENFDQTTADCEATPEPPISLYDLNRSIITPSSTSSRNDSYFTHTTPDTHKFSRRVELSSGYNILKNRTSSRPTRLPAYLQGPTPLAQLNPLPATVTVITNTLPDDNRQRRLSFTDHYRTQHLAYTQQILQQFNADGTRRPFSSDSPLPPPLPSTTYYAPSAPLVHNRTAYEPIEPLKLALEQEDNSIAELSRELRAAAYPTTRKSSNHSPSRETSPPTTRYSTRMNAKRVPPPPRSLPKLHPTDQPPQTIISNIKSTHFYHHHEPDKLPSTVDDHLQSSSTASLLLDQFFNPEQTHELIPVNTEKHEYTQPPVLLMRTPSLPNSSDDTTMSFVSKYARLAPIVTSQTATTTLEINSHDQTLDISSFHTENVILTDDLFQTSEMINPDHTIEDDYSYVPLKEQLNSINGIPLLELDELETNSDMSESQLVPIIYAKELANEIELLQKAHLLKQQQRSISMNNENERINDNNSVPPPANMELLNFEALEEEFCILQRREDTPSPSPTIQSTMMEISSPPLSTKPPESLPSPSEIETSMNNIFQHSILAHNRASPWFKLPTELWFKILPFLNSHELHNFSYACKRFYLLVQDQACRHRIVIHHRMQLEQVWFDVLSRRKPISLSFIDCRQQNLENTPQSENIPWLEFFQSIGSNLLDFTMSGCYHEPFTPNTLLPIIVQTCSHLRSLNLRWNNITESTLNHLITYPQWIQLRTLDFTGCQTLDDTLLINLFIRTEAEFHLEKLVLQACTNITWISLDTIAICIPNLTHLNVSRCIGLTNLSSNQNLTCFHYWPKLQHIDLGHLLTLTDNDLNIIFANCKYLNALILDDDMNLTDQTLNQLTIDFQLLNLRNCTNFSTNALIKLTDQCPYLHTIDLSSIKNFNDQCLLEWTAKPLIQLKSLALNQCTDCTMNTIESFLEQHANLRYFSFHPPEESTLREKFHHLQIVFQ